MLVYQSNNNNQEHVGEEVLGDASLEPRGSHYPFHNPFLTSTDAQLHSHPNHTHSMEQQQQQPRHFNAMAMPQYDFPYILPLSSSSALLPTTTSNMNYTYAPISMSTATPGMQMGMVTETPTTVWSDTPRTQYQNSPGTELGDFERDTYTVGDRDTVVVNNTHPTASPRIPAVVSNGFNMATGVTPEQMKEFTSRLNNDIRSVALFAPSAAVATTTLAASLQQAQQQQQQQSHFSQQSSASVPTPATPTIHDVTPSQSHSQSQLATIGSGLQRKPSFHLRPPLHPIDPFFVPQRFAPGTMGTTPLRPLQQVQLYPALAASARKTVMPDVDFGMTVSPKDLMLNLHEVGAQDVKVEAEVEVEAENDVVGGGAEDFGGFDFGFFAQQTFAAAPMFSVPAQVGEELEMPVMVGMKRSKEEEDADDEDEDADGEDDDEYRATRAMRSQQQPPAKRTRLSYTRSSPSPVATPPTPTRTQAAPTPAPAASSSTNPPFRRPAGSNKPRTRHLQPNLVRNNPCMHGCPLLFSTAYEARRHQEDAHGREEAQLLLSQAPTAPIRARDFKFLIPIAIHTQSSGSSSGEGTRWSSSIKAEAQRVLDAAGEVEGGSELGRRLREFGEFWCRRYVCPGCGIAFSRLDSKKRHYEKGCQGK